MNTQTTPKPFPRESEIAEELEMLAQMSIDEGDKQSAARDMDRARAIRRLIDMLTEANGLLRSTSEVAKRQGVATNWQPFEAALMKALKRQHKAMYPKYATP